MATTSLPDAEPRGVAEPRMRRGRRRRPGGAGRCRCPGRARRARPAARSPSSERGAEGGRAFHHVAVAQRVAVRGEQHAGALAAARTAVGAAGGDVHHGGADRLEGGDHARGVGVERVLLGGGWRWRRRPGRRCRAACAGCGAVAGAAPARAIVRGRSRTIARWEAARGAAILLACLETRR